MPRGVRGSPRDFGSLSSGSNPGGAARARSGVRVGEAQGPLTAIVLAAGRGKRMRSELPKVLHTVAGRPLVAHVLEALRPLPVARRVVVTSQPAEPVEAAVRDNGFAQGIDFV